MKSTRKAFAVSLSALTAVMALAAPQPQQSNSVNLTASALSISDMPSEYQYAADWIWENRICAENATGSGYNNQSKRYNGMFDQIIDGQGTLNYIVRWHSTKTITLQQRQNLEIALEECVNAWTDYLVDYDSWPYQHVDVRIVGWAVTDPSLLLDLQSDEIVYTNAETYVIQSGESQEIPTTMASGPSELSRFDHFFDESYEYPGGLDKRFDQYLWATQGFPDYGGCGGDWGQRLSDNYYIGMAEGTSSKHVQIHELGHGFGITDFYGGEGASDGFPPGGFPGNGTSIMMAGSSSVITDFDGWMLRYMWSKLLTENGRIDLANAVGPDSIVGTQTSSTSVSTTTTTTTTTTVDPPIGDVVSLPVHYDSNNQYWLVDTNGAATITLEATGLPWAALSGGYGYWDSVDGAWVTGEYQFENSLGDDGVETVIITIPAEDVTTQLQIQVYYYAQWSNDANDMVAQDPSTLQFRAYGVPSAITTSTTSDATTTTSTTTTTTTTITTTDSEADPPVDTLIGDVNCDGNVKINDVILLNRFLAEDGDVEISDQGLRNGDVDLNGQNTSEDAVAILRILAGLNSE